MKKIVIFGTMIFVVVFCAFGIWFWSLGAVVASEGIPPIRVDLIAGTVEIKSAGTDSFKPLLTSTQIAVNDVLRTGDSGKAEIRWGDRGITRIEPKTELQIEASPDSNRLTNASIKLHLVSGKVWNRMYKLLDVQSDIQVRTDSVVATVRGTAFGVGADAGGFETAVTESVVNIGSIDGKTGSLVREGRWGRFANDGNPEIVRDLTDQDSWPNEQRAKDRQYDDEMRHAADARLKRLQGKGPAWLRALSEQLHLAMTSGETSDELAAAYAVRRVADVAEAREEGSKSADFDSLLRKARNSSNAWQSYLSSLRDLSLLPDPSQPSGRVLRDAMWRLREQALNETLVARRYALALNIDDDIDALVMRDIDSSRESDVEKLRREIDAWQEGSREGLSSDEMTKLANKADALRERLRGLGTLPVQSNDQPSVEVSTTSTSDVIEPVIQPVTDGVIKSGTGGKPKIQPVKPFPTTETCVAPRMSLFIKPTTISLSQTAGLILIKACVDGKTEDVTARSVFNVSDLSIADVRGAYVYPRKIGRVNVTGSYTVDGRTLSDTQAVTISDVTSDKKLTAIRVMTNGPTTLTTGQRATLEAIAGYDDGTTKPVTYQCVWSVSDSRLAMISGNTFQHLQGTGSVDAVCSYTENGTTVKGSLRFVIELDSALQPTQGTPTPKYRYPYSYVP
ncbi:FecR domain-containing protein [Candidatus Uhrbacteria bacterium]|nr:FecR domain-containing protein [Candidatus Uhrbacteria bacterium]